MSSEEKGLEGMFSDWGLSWGGWLDNRRGEWWLLAQLILISAHLLPPWPAPAVLGLESWPQAVCIVGVLLLLSGIVMAAQAFDALGSSLSPLPAAKQGNRLIRQGPYQRCRHPMYQAVLLCSLGVVLALGSLVHLLLLMGLIAVLGSKARREERSLLELHADYVNYRSTTPAIASGLPWLDWRR